VDRRVGLGEPDELDDEPDELLDDDGMSAMFISERGRVAAK
jgi:hypothetical protein